MRDGMKLKKWREKTCPTCESPKRNDRQFIEDEFNPGMVGRCHHEWHAEIIGFDEAQVGDHAYTWEIAPSGTMEDPNFGEYHFEVADDPRDLYGEDRARTRKLWLLVEVTHLEAEDDTATDDG